MDKQKITELKTKILTKLSENPSWQLKTIDNYWICPYCGMIGSRFDEPEKMLPEVLGHLLKVCPEKANNDKTELTQEKLIQIQKAQNWLRSTGKKVSFQLTDDENRWYCPYCAQRQKIVIDFTKPSTAQVINIIKHIESCSEKHDGTDVLDPEQVDLAIKLRRDKRFRYYNIKDDRWFCPLTLKITNIKRDVSKKITRKQVLETYTHLENVCESLGRELHPASVEIIERSLREEYEKERLLHKIKQNVFSDETWQVIGNSNHWICPYCRKQIKGIDVKTALSKKVVAPQQIFNHLTETCIEFQTGKEPAKSIEDFEATKKSTRHPAYKRSLKTFLSFVESETSMRKKEAEIVESDTNILNKRDEYNRKMLEKAKKVQLQMLPKIPEIKGLEFAVHYKSCDELSGDFYDFFEVSEHELGIVVGDVSGHGVTAALVMAATKKALKITGKGRSPKTTMLIVNDELRSEIPMATFVTVFYGVLNLQTFELKYVRAGHNPLYIFNENRDPKFNEYKAKGMIIGAADSNLLNNMLVEDKIQLYRGDFIIQYTDGVIEAMNPEREEFGDQRFREFITENNNLTASNFVESLSESIDNFYNGAEPNDDVTIVAVKIL